MTKKIQEVALSIFLLVCAISLLMGLLWLKPVINSQRLLIDETRLNQEKIIKEAENIKAIITEWGYALAVTEMMKNEIIPPATANKMFEESIVNIETHSERFGKLARLLNDFRINKQRTMNKKNKSNKSMEREE